MNFSRFFVDRPIFAGVLSALITIAGAIAIVNLPVSEYPDVVPPSVVVRATYPGANPKVIAQTVAGWDPEATSKRLELAVGRDLQFVRMNGTIVGGLVGLLIYAVPKLFD